MVVMLLSRMHSKVNAGKLLQQSCTHDWLSQARSIQEKPDSLLYVKVSLTPHKSQQLRKRQKTRKLICFVATWNEDNGSSELTGLCLSCLDSTTLYYLLVQTSI